MPARRRVGRVDEGGEAGGRLLLQLARHAAVGQRQERLQEVVGRARHRGERRLRLVEMRRQDGVVVDAAPRGWRRRAGCCRPCPVRPPRVSPTSARRPVVTSTFALTISERSRPQSARGELRKEAVETKVAFMAMTIERKHELVEQLADHADQLRGGGVTLLQLDLLGVFVVHVHAGGVGQGVGGTRDEASSGSRCRSRRSGEGSRAS